MRLPPLPSVADLLRLYKLRALRQLSQNFLLDARVCSKIVRAAGKLQNEHVAEVGPGPGSITRAILAKGPASLLVVEKDRRFLPTLELLEDAVKSTCDMKILVGDVLHLNMETLFPEEAVTPWTSQPPPIHLIGNLPFNVSTPLIISWLRDISLRRSAWRYGRVRMTLTFQKEVAERLVAPVLSSQRSRLSLMAQNYCRLRHVTNIPGSAFVPKPKVDVGVVHLEPMVSPVVDLPFNLFEKVVKAIFSFRQKYCIRGVETLFPLGVREAMAAQVLNEAGVDPTTRPLQLVLPDVGRIASAYHSLIQQHPSMAKYNPRGPPSLVVESLA